MKQNKVATNLQQDFTAAEQAQARENIGINLDNLSDGSNVKYAGALSEIDLSKADMKIYRDRIQNPTMEYSKLYIKNEYDSNKTFTMVDTDAASGFLFKLASGPIISQEIPRVDSDFQILQIINVDVDSYSYTLNIEEGKGYVLACDSSAGDITLSTNVTDHPVHTILVITADGDGSCPSFRIKWKDEMLADCYSSFEFQDDTSNAEYIMHVWIQKLYNSSTQQYYSVARVTDYPVAYRSIPDTVDTSYDSVVQVGASW